ncbi:MAG: LruC domain-containing protein [Myxococcales bacterium]|nr:LruC domain-containing protein [Myxococcales bacterium]
MTPWPALLSALLSAAALPPDFDGDGITDALDGAPCAPESAGVHFVPAEDSWGTLLVEDGDPASADLDFNDVVVDWRFAVEAERGLTGLRGVLRIRALGSARRLGLGLRLPGTATVAVQVDLRMAGAFVPAEEVVEGAERTVVLVPELRTLFPDAVGTVNTDPAVPTRPPVELQVDLHFEAPVRITPDQVPQGLVVFLADDPSAAWWPAAPPRTPEGLPLALLFPEAVPHPSEAVALSTAFPDVLRFAATRGIGARRFYEVYVGAPFTRRAWPAPPPADDGGACLPECDALTCRARFALDALMPCRETLPRLFERDAIAPPGPSSNGYRPPEDESRLQVARSLLAVAAGNGGRATLEAEDGGYQVCRAPREPVAVWRPVSSGRGRALLAWRVEGGRPVLIGAPHPNYEVGTLQQALQMFEVLPGRALMVSGTHRCASEATSECSGLTAVCTDDDAPFRVSDMAHTTESIYQTAHEVLADLYPEDWVVSLHGMGDEGVSLSDGTLAPLRETDALARVLQGFLQLFPAENITACNPQPWAPVDTRLCGTTNAQGRYLNGAADACSMASEQSAGRFVHLEQSRAVREQAEKVLDVFGAAVPAQ